jgi:GT2 family glycosyltransferase
MKLSIVVLAFNKLNFTKACLNDLFKLPEDHEIIIVDNGSTDGTYEYLQNLTPKPNLVVLRMKENVGFAKGCNFGYNESSAPNVLFLNNDIRVKSKFETWTQPLLDKCQEGLVGPTMGQLNSQLQFVQESNCVLSGNSYLSGWCVAGSKETWNKLEIPRKGAQLFSNENVPQIFSEEFGLAYFEDTDLGFRAKKLGIKTNVVDVPVVHFGKQSSSQLNTYALYSTARSIFVKKWANKTI